MLSPIYHDAQPLLVVVILPMSWERHTISEIGPLFCYTVVHVLCTCLSGVWKVPKGTRGEGTAGRIGTMGREAVWDTLEGLKLYQNTSDAYQTRHRGLYEFGWGRKEWGGHRTYTANCWYCSASLKRRWTYQCSSTLLAIQSFLHQSITIRSSHLSSILQPFDKEASRDMRLKFFNHQKYFW
jgi:hypothetical protein